MTSAPGKTFYHKKFFEVRLCTPPTMKVPPLGLCLCLHAAATPQYPSCIIVSTRKCHLEKLFMIKSFSRCAVVLTLVC